jgi:uncharacterized protein (DUF362 family)
MPLDDVLMPSAYLSNVEGKLRDKILEGLEFIGWRKIVKKDDVVFIKPNFTFPLFREGITTNPEVIKFLLELMKGRCVQVIVGESDGGNHSFKAEEAFAGHNMMEICKETGAELVNLSNLPSKFVGAEILSKRVRVQLPKILLEEVDCFISMPVLKVHVMTGVSLGLKNLWGCYPDAMRCLHHQDLDRKLTLMAKILNPKITIIDGLYALDGHGPMYGEPVKTDLLLMSNNVVVADALGAAIMNIPLKRAKHILVAEKEGIGTTRLEDININTNWSKYRREFRIRKTIIDRLSTISFHSYAVAKLIMDSPLTPLVYKVVAILRTSEEKAVANQLESYKHYI